jgi:hypothetical protein
VVTLYYQTLDVISSIEQTKCPIEWVPLATSWTGFWEAEELKNDSLDSITIISKEREEDIAPLKFTSLVCL